MANDLFQRIVHAADELGLEKAKRDIREAPPGTQGVFAPIVWTGTLRDLANFAISQFKKSRIQANSEMDALRQISQHFVRPGGGRIDPRSLWQNYKNKKDKDAGKI
jgi:hypothetical protein